MAEPTLEQLLSLVHADPERDEPRLVYADALMQQGDVRGEFIARQLGAIFHGGDRKRRRAHRDRLEQLLSAHARQWLGPLLPVLLPDYVFERGFLARCTVSTTRASLLREVEGHPLWATVHTLAGSLRIALHPILGALRHLTVDMTRALEAEGLTSPWGALLGEDERPITRLSYRASRHPSARELELLGACPALPRLEALTVRDDREPVLAALLQGPVLQRLERLSLETMGVPRPELLAAPLLAAPVPELSLRLVRADLTLVLQREGNRYAHIEITSCGPTSLQPLGALLDLLPELSSAIVRVPADHRDWWVQEVRYLLSERGL
jgi:uncharacterized protein (TIGR02996 family)